MKFREIYGKKVKNGEKSRKMGKSKAGVLDFPNFEKFEKTKVGIGVLDFPNFKKNDKN